jgi:hypothetical protein
MLLRAHFALFHFHQLRYDKKRLWNLEMRTRTGFLLMVEQNDYRQKEQRPARWRNYFVDFVTETIILATLTVLTIQKLLKDIRQ